MTPADELNTAEREQLAQGFHAELAAALGNRERWDLAAWVLEQIWDWEGALAAYRNADRSVDALRVAIESGAAQHLDAVLEDIEEHAVPEDLEAAIALLQKRRRPLEAARLLALRDDPLAQARALLRGGDRLGAAQALAEAGEPKEALDILQSHALDSHTALALAATLAWELGDAEASARFAQTALRLDEDDDATRDQLSRSLDALGHDLAAQMVLRGQSSRSVDAVSPGRYRVTALGGAGIVGTTYFGLDRATLEEVEVHLLLAEQGEGQDIDPEITRQLQRFGALATAASELGHPAIRPVLRFDPHAGLLVMPRTEGPTLRALLRPPGLRRGGRSRARALVAFLLEGLTVAHQRGLVHGWLLPSLVVFDAAGRPLLPPFGAHHLSGLTATHTGGLEELMALTAPELRSGGPPTVASDLFAVGALLRGLLDGGLRGDEAEEPGAETSPLQAPPEAILDTPEDALAAALLAEDPSHRPAAAEALEILTARVADLQEVGIAASQSAEGSTPATGAPRIREDAVRVLAADSWTDELLDSLCAHATGWLQPILDREDRWLTLAAWPEGCRSLDGGVEDFVELLDPTALQLATPGLESAVRTRLAPTSLVRTPAGAWMIALDDVLTR